MIRLSNILTEADDKNFTNPALNKKIKYTDNDGKQKENSVGNLLRLQKDNPGRLAAEKTLPKPGTPERKSINRTLGREKDGATIGTAQNTKVGGDTKPEKPTLKTPPPASKPQPATMYKADPAMAARMDTEKKTQAKLAKDAETANTVNSPKKPDITIPGKKPGTIIKKSDGKPDVVLPAPKAKEKVPSDTKPKLNLPPAPKEKAKVPPPPPALPKSKDTSHSSDGHGDDKDNAGWRKNAKTAVTKPKVYARAIKDGIKDWKEDEKDFFKEKVHKGDTPKRRSWGEALKHKAVGAWHAIKKGAQHEVETFKKAGEGIVMWTNGMPLTDEQTNAMKSVAKKVIVAGVLGIATGGLSHGVMPFVSHIMAEFVPHIIAETILVGATKAAVFAGPMDMVGGKEDEAIQKFMDAVAEKMAKEDIPLDMIAKSVEFYNKEKKEKGGEDITQNEAKLAVNQLQQLVKESIIR